MTEMLTDTMTELWKGLSKGALRGPWLLALHSSSEMLGVGIQSLSTPELAPVLASFPLGRGLANALLDCVEQVLPASHWGEVGRLAVATGPGGFTGTRLTLALARTLAQQLTVPLHGVSSFHLIAHRLWRAPERPLVAPFWLVQELPRHGLVAGLYEPDPGAPRGMAERLAPRLYADAQALATTAPAPLWPATPKLPDDVAELLACAQAAAAAGHAAPWQPVLPLYPTGPVPAP
jgi:tRNA threonylcarbamoyl adenosine modification protein YeaZ